MEQLPYPSFRRSRSIMTNVQFILPINLEGLIRANVICCKCKPTLNKDDLI